MYYSLFNFHLLIYLFSNNILIQSIAKLHISLKETGESIYWIKLLKNTNLLNIQESNKLLAQAEEIKRILIASLNTVKEKLK